MPISLPGREDRQLPMADANWTLRDDAEDKPRIFTGYASKFNDRTAIGNPLSWGFYEEVAPGAFTKTLSEGDASFLFGHDDKQIISRVSAGDLRLAQDKTGLSVEAELDDEVSYVRDLIRNLQKRKITGMSFGFEVTKDDWEMVDVENRDGGTVQAELRTLREVKLWEVSAVTFPAYKNTEAQLRSVATALVRRGDSDAIERHARLKPELYRYTETDDREPAEATRGDQEPAVSTLSVAAVDLRMRGLAARYSLPMP